jgi:hypothetical protein
VPPAAAAAEQDDTFDPLGAFLQDLDSNSDNDIQDPDVNEIRQESKPVDLFEGENSGGASDSSDDDDDLGDDDLDDFDLDIFDDPAFDESLDDGPKRSSSDKSEEDVDPDDVAQLFALDDEDSNDDSDDSLSNDDVAILEVQPEESKPAPLAQRQEPLRREEPARREEIRPPATRNPKNRDSQTPPAIETLTTKPATQVRSSSQGQIRPRIGGMPNRVETKPVVAAHEQQRGAGHTPNARTAEGREKPARATSVAQQPQPKAQPVTPSTRSRAEGNPPRAQAHSSASKPTQSAGTAEAVRPNKMKAGRLFGWLVSYENQDGRAIELRAGRFFVTGTSIRSTDLILEDQSISTPHALMSITDNGLQLQDLMSERGTFVRFQGEAQYTREEGVVEVRHGDWIRFGDVEFLLTVVPA